VACQCSAATAEIDGGSLARSDGRNVPFSQPGGVLMQRGNVFNRRGLLARSDGHDMQDATASFPEAPRSAFDLPSRENGGRGSNRAQ